MERKIKLFCSAETILDLEVKKLKASALGIVKRNQCRSVNKKSFGQIIYLEAFLHKLYSILSYICVEFICIKEWQRTQRPAIWPNNN